MASRYESDFNDDIYGFDKEENMLPYSKISKFIYTTYNNVNSNLNDTNILYNTNDYYLEDICDNLITLYSEFPVWTNVLRKYYEHSSKDASSSGSENRFRHMRNEYDMSCPVTLNRFVLKDIQILDGATIILVY